jgi:KDO2-lipid IV(A) lauroyltransferase
MPLDVLYRLATLLGWIYFSLSLRSRRRIIKGIQFAFKEEKGDQEIERLTREAMVNFFKNYLELFFFAGPHRSKLLRRVTIEGREHLDRALSQGKGAIVVSAHLNNFALIVLKLAHEGYPIAMAVRDFKNPVQSRIYKGCRRLISLKSILIKPSSHFLRDVLRLLKRNGIICLVADENKRHGGVFVDFFGHPAATATGPAHLALKTGTPVVTILMVREIGNTQRVVIEPPLEFEPSGNKGGDTEMITSKFTMTIESYVRKYPGQWRWDHFRWKTQPERVPEQKKPSQLSLFDDIMI